MSGVQRRKRGEWRWVGEESDLPMNTEIEVPVLSLNVENAAKAIGVSKRQLLAIKAAGDLPYIEVGPQTFLFDPIDLQAWLLRNKKPKARAENGQCQQ
jgi:hypothetical protein